MKIFGGFKKSRDAGSDEPGGPAEAPASTYNIKNIFKIIAAFFKDLFLRIKNFFAGLIQKVFKKSTPDSNAPTQIYEKGENKEAALLSEDSFDDSTRVFSPVKDGDLPIQGKKSKERLPGINPEQFHGEDKYFPTIFRKRAYRPNMFLSVVLTTVKVAVAALLVFIAIGAGSVFGIANAYLETTPELNLDLIEDQSLTSYIYDCNGKQIGTFTGLENRDWASLDEIPKLLQEAVISVEDTRFYNHNGIDFKRIVGAFISNFTSDTVQGGSTITQQLIKNQLLTSERSYKRKIQEAKLAMELEEKYTKDQILEAYLNTIPLGGSNYGVKAAAKDYFGKDLKDLSLREIACLAGITRYPYAYNPRTVYFGSDDPSVTAKRKIALDDRITTVLDNMYNGGYITLTEARAAIKDSFSVKEESTAKSAYQYPHFVEYAIDDVITHLIQQRNLTDNTQNRQAIENELRSKGYRIYTTLDPDMQEMAQTTITEYDHYPALKDASDSVVKQTNADGSITEVQEPQAACVILDQHTGFLKAIIGSRTEPTSLKTFNRASESTMPVGSSIKPIAVYGPAFDLGASPATVIPNVPVAIPGWNTSAGYPRTSQGTYGPTTIRKGIVNSLNIVAARTLVDLVGAKTSAKYLTDLGVNPKHINQDGPGLALGTSGLTPIEMAGAFAALANGGEYLEPMSFTKVEDSKGNVVIDATKVREKKQVFKASTAFMLTDVLENAVRSGTGTRARISGMHVAGKTGTNQENRGVFFAGYTPYYTQTVWVGHDNYKQLANGVSASTGAAPLWQKIMSQLVEDLPDKEIYEGDPSDYGVVKGRVCAVSGLKPNGYCEKTVTDYFAAGTIPTEKCNMCVQTSICTVSGKIASEFCPKEFVKNGTGISIPKDSVYAKLSTSQLIKIFPNLVTANPTQDQFCDVHTAEWAAEHAQLPTYVEAAQTQISRANNLIKLAKDRMTSTQLANIKSLVSDLKTIIKDPYADIHVVDAATQKLKKALDMTENSLAPVSPEPSDTVSPEPSDSVSPSPDDTTSPGPSVIPQ